MDSFEIYMELHQMAYGMFYEFLGTDIKIYFSSVVLILIFMWTNINLYYNEINKNENIE